MVSGRSPHTGFGSSKGCSRWRGDTWSVGMVAMGVGLDLMILEIFSDLSDSMVPCYTWKCPWVLGVSACRCLQWEQSKPKITERPSLAGVELGMP